MITYKEYYNKLEVFYKDKNIGYISKGSGFNFNRMTFSNGFPFILLEKEIDESKKYLEEVIHKMEQIIL